MLKDLDRIAMQVGDCLVRSSPSVRNLGVIFDTRMSMEKQVISVCKSAYAQLRNIGRVRRYLTNRAARSLTNGLVASRLDYCNSLLCGLPKTVTKRLQQVQNTAARIVTRTPRSEHITPVLKRLQWLPFKTLMHVFKCLHGQAPGYLSDMINAYQPPGTSGQQAPQVSRHSLPGIVPRARPGSWAPL
jgi:hypothetical protein